VSLGYFETAAKIQAKREKKKMETRVPLRLVPYVNHLPKVGDASFWRQ